MQFHFLCGSKIWEKGWQTSSRISSRTAFNSCVTIAEEERHYANLGINCGYLDLQTWLRREQVVGKFVCKYLWVGCWQGPRHTWQALMPSLPPLLHHGATRFTISFEAANRQFREWVLSYFALPPRLRYIILLKEGVESNPRSHCIADCTHREWAKTILPQFAQRTTSKQKALRPISIKLLTNCHCLLNHRRRSNDTKHVRCDCRIQTRGHSIRRSLNFVI